MLAVALLFDLAAAAPAGVAIGNAQLGREKGDAERCFECHGVDGQGSPQGTESIFARLAGQSAGYIERQVRAFRSGLRHSDSMRIPAREVGDADLRDIAAYFAAQPPMRDGEGRGRDDGAGDGARLAAVGDAVRGIAACASCHGDKGQGLPAINAPRLAGQAARYLEKQLRDWRGGQRRDASGVAAMAPIAVALTEAELGALARHYSSLTTGAP